MGAPGAEGGDVVEEDAFELCEILGCFSLEQESRSGEVGCGGIQRAGRMVKAREG